MRIVVQRVSHASVAINERLTGEIARGLLILVGIESADETADGEWLAAKATKLRIFPGDTGHMDKSVVDVAGGILLISQFTLHASTQKGARPSFSQAAPPDQARELYTQFIAQLSGALGRPIATGEFGADMKVSLLNDGPVTIIIDSKRRE